VSEFEPRGKSARFKQWLDAEWGIIHRSKVQPSVFNAKRNKSPFVPRVKIIVVVQRSLLPVVGPRGQAAKIVMPVAFDVGNAQ
jgi:hypothetical protein